MSRIKLRLHNVRSPALCLVALISLSGCFFGETNPPSEVSLTGIISGNNDISVETLSTHPLLYRMEVQGNTFYATAMKQCGVRDFVPSKATTRQLLVGFEKINIQQQGFIENTKHKIFRSEITAVLDDQPIALVTYTRRSADCVTDYTFWTPGSDALGTRIEPVVLTGIDSNE